MPQSRPWVCLRFPSCTTYILQFVFITPFLFLNVFQTLETYVRTLSHIGICETEHHWLIGIRPCSAHSVFFDCGFVSSQGESATDIFVQIFELIQILFSFSFYTSIQKRFSFRIVPPSREYASPLILTPTWDH